MKKILLLTSLLLFLLTTPIYGSEQNMKLFIHNKEITSNLYTETDTTNIYVPIRSMFEALNSEVLWQEPNIKLEFDNHSIEFSKNSRTAYLDSNEIFIDFPIKIYNDRAYIAIKALEKLLNCNINTENDTININFIKDSDLEKPITPPEIILFNHNANFITFPVNWENTKIENTTIYFKIHDNDDVTTNIYRPKPDEIFKFKFKNCLPPDKVSVKMSYINDITNISGEYVENVESLEKNNIFYFMNQPIPEPTTDYGSRIYVIEASWGHNVCQYAFITDNKWLYDY